MISKIIADKRRELGLTLKELAQRVGVSEGTVQRWEKGNIKNLKHDKIGKLADALGITPMSLMGFDVDVNLRATDAPVSMVPVIGRIAAGKPLLAVEHLEGYEPAPVPDPDNHFYLIVTGDSMINAGIKEGYRVLVKKQRTAKNGQIVVCRLNGEDATLKRFYRTGETVVLHPENSAYSPTIIPVAEFDCGYCSIIGVVLMVTFSV